ncbi:hypothetical protein PHYBOEH_008259 [Phytophthora boehmeriae]|uniref:BZIP domain-containing protein n=1 Tax=Phytophthora boehmeriae TaxID=109152 RepID=A0A8T1W2A1_9STRA|nr:hypothetical protein PHYBOEH_008259 [Phytophthora boehmeriae]
MIDRDIAPKTYGEWENPKNVTEKVIQLATTGELQTLQLTNRYLPVLPEELRRCTNLKHLSLEYTHIQTLPAWAKEFTRLEFLHVESKFSSPVVALPDDLFDDMSSLTFIHFAAFIPMTKMPSFDGLTNLKSLTLAVFLALEEIPALDSLGNLERLVLSSMPAMNSLPDFAPLKNLNTFFVSDRGAWCCNGFLGICDLSDGKCGVHPLWGSPAATCLPPNQGEKIASAATLSATAKFASTICGPVLQPGALEGPPTPDIMDPCNGTMYRHMAWLQIVSISRYEVEKMRDKTCGHYQRIGINLFSMTLRFSDDVISDVIQRGLDRSVTDVSSLYVEHHSSNPVATEEPKRQEGQVAICLKDFRRGDQLTRRERNRIYQARYKLRQKKLANDLDLSVQKLREDVEQLEKQRLALSYTPLTNSTVWNVAAEYFRLFRHGFNKFEISSNAAPVTHLTFLQQTMTPDVMIETGSGIEAVMESWMTAFNYFNDLDCQLMRLENGPGETLVCVMKVRVGVTLHTLRHVFPHLFVEGILTPLGGKMLGQQLCVSCNVHLKWDPSRGRISSMTYDGDFMTPLLQLLGNLEDVSHVFGDAYVSPDCRLVVLA